MSFHIGTLAQSFAKVITNITGQHDLLVSNIHDELIVECPTVIAEAVRDILVSSMVEGMQWVFPEVRIDVEAKICATWAEK